MSEQGISGYGPGSNNPPSQPNRPAFRGTCVNTPESDEPAMEDRDRSPPRGQPIPLRYIVLAKDPLQDITTRRLVDSGIGLNT